MSARCACTVLEPTLPGMALGAPGAAVALAACEPHEWWCGAAWGETEAEPGRRSQDLKAGWWWGADRGLGVGGSGWR